jgi:undecaprenyl-diphosphatase
VPALLAGTALALLVGAALQMDRPAIEFVRSLREIWIERVGDAGSLLGKGWTLAAVSGLFVAAGWLKADSIWRDAGLRGWIAHAVTAILVQGLKHGIGRPRPRLHQEDTFFAGPTLESGLDSFPSGHASASFAVATVMANYFPRWARAVYALAGFVALTRIFRGSHFVSDALAGIVLGLVVGTLAAAPASEWSGRLGALAVPGVSWLVAGCAVVWLIVLPSPDTLTTGLLLVAGALAGLAQWLARRRGSDLL